MKKVLIIDGDKCTGCRACVLACSFAKERVFNLSKARIRVLKDEGDCLAVPLLCEQCTHPPCRDVCPVKAIAIDLETGIVNIDLEKCTGCGLCKWVCPFGAETITIRERLAIKCDLCDGNPSCLEACLPRAIRYIPATPETIQQKWNFAEKRATTLTSLSIRRAA